MKHTGLAGYGFAVVVFTGCLCVEPCSILAQHAAQSPGMDFPDDAPIISTRHKLSFDGKTLSYTAPVGFPLFYDDFRETRARLIYLAYTLDSKRHKARRPLTFAWNGDPGSPASTLHLASFGPKRAKTADEYVSTRRTNVVFGLYCGGRSTYTEKHVLRELSHDINEFMKGTVPPGKPIPSAQ